MSQRIGGDYSDYENERDNDDFDYDLPENYGDDLDQIDEDEDYEDDSIDDDDDLIDDDGFDWDLEPDYDDEDE